MNKFLRSLLAGLLVVLTLGLSACGAGGNDSSKPLVVLADATPHTDILKKVQELGLLGDTKIEIKGIAGDIDVNQLTQSGDVDANFFQHKPYLDTWLKQKGVTDLTSVATVHVEPLGLYSKKVKSLTEVPNGATIAIPQDPSNLVRALFLLQQAKLITLNVNPTDANLDFSQITEKNISANPKGLKFIQIDRPQLAATLDDAKVDLSVINGNYALEAGLKPKTDALVLETATNNPYANLLVVKADKKDDPRVKKLAEALQSKEIQDWITSNYEGSVLPAKQS
ncbi:MetQ/NlpA family ABC transporter substrate-binding protein [Luteococcus sp. H138]|uniref:MetQ/NlpA family ABC transporter substrate-binding protein n=1 Tax=unclassified Luteococcus TaxID=2639923 RepID=UPI00313E882B